MGTKVTKVTMYKDKQGYVWETEKEAIDNNIESFIPCLTSEDYEVNKQLLLEWFRNEKHQVRYVLANIDKIMDKREDE